MEIGLRGKELGELERLLRLFEAGELSGALTVARLLLVTRDVSSIERWLQAHVATEARNRLLHLIEQHRHGCQCVAALRDAEAVRERKLGAAPGDFSADPSVLAKAELTERATRELVERFEAWGLLGPGQRTLELGCGAGRLQAALSPRVALAAGVDASPEMVARARWCCSRLPNARHEVGHGADLGAFGAASFRLVYAVDSFPSPESRSSRIDPSSNVAPRDERVTNPFAEVARVLEPGGEFVFQLRPSAAGLSEHDLTGLAQSQGFDVITNGERAFQWWDGLTYRLERRA